jgi:hypothetical protein
MLDTINTGAQSNVTLFEFVGVRMSVFVTRTTFIRADPDVQVDLTDGDLGDPRARELPRTLTGFF